MLRERLPQTVVHWSNPIGTGDIGSVNGQSGLGVFVEPDRLIWHEGRNCRFDKIMAAELATGRVRAVVTNRNRAIERYAQELLPR